MFEFDISNIISNIYRGKILFKVVRVMLPNWHSKHKYWMLILMLQYMHICALHWLLVMLRLQSTYPYTVY